jgi:hypothetical protein
MENRTKKAILLGLFTELKTDNAEKFISIWNDMCFDSTLENHTAIYKNTSDGLGECLDYLEYKEIAEIFLKSLYVPSHKYFRFKDGLIQSFDSITHIVDVGELVTFLIDDDTKVSWFNIHDYVDGFNFEKHQDFIISTIINSYDTNLSYDDVSKYFAIHNIKNVGDVMLLDFRKMVIDIKTPIFDKLSTKEDIFDAMRDILKDREDKKVNFANHKCVLKQKFCDRTEDMAILSVQLYNDVDGTDLIVQNTEVLMFGEPSRMGRSIMRLSLNEMQELFDLMLKNI